MLVMMGGTGGWRGVSGGEGGGCRRWAGSGHDGGLINGAQRPETVVCLFFRSFVCLCVFAADRRLEMRQFAVSGTISISTTPAPPPLPTPTLPTRPEKKKSQLVHLRSDQRRPAAALPASWWPALGPGGAVGPLHSIQRREAASFSRSSPVSSSSSSSPLRSSYGGRQRDTSGFAFTIKHKLVREGLAGGRT